MARRLKGEGSWGEKTINGIQYIYFRKIYNGKIKDFYGKTRKDVLSKVKQFESANTTNNNDIVKSSFESYFYNWLQNIRIFEVSDGTYSTDIKTYNANIKNSDLARKQIGIINTRMIQDYVNELSLKYSRSTIKKIFYMYSLCYKYAVRVGDVSVNPCENVILPKEKDVVIKKKDIPFLEKDDIERLYMESFRLNNEFIKLTGQPGTRVYGINSFGINIILYTGLRASELCALQWKHVDLENKKLYVEQSLHKKYEENTKKEIYVLGIPKRNSKRVIPLSDRAMESFMEIKKFRGNVSQDDFVITCQQRRLSATLDRMLVRANCSVKHCGLHAIRHTFGSMLLSKGVDIKTISTLMGHKDISTTANIYLDVTEKLAIDSVNLLNKMNSQ